MTLWRKLYTVGTALSVLLASCAPTPTGTPLPLLTATLPAAATQLAAATLVAPPSATPLTSTTTPVALTTTAPAATATLLAPPTATLDPASPQSWREDLHFLADTLVQEHPNPFWRASKADFQSLVDSLDADIPHLTREQILVGFIRLTAMLDGHTQINITQPALGFHAYPLHLYLFGDGLFVIGASAPYQDAIGARVVQIGRDTPDQLFPLLTRLANHDNDMTIQLYLPLFAVVPEVLRAEGVITDTAQPAIVVQKPDGERVTLNPAPIDFSEYRQQWQAATILGLPHEPTPLYQSRPNENFWFTFLADSKTLYIQYNHVQASTQSGQSLGDFTQQIATFVAQNDVQRVVVDIRHNGGGENSTYTPLLQMLGQNPAINRPGKLFTLIGRSTFSAATQFATELEHSSHSVFVGEPTGGSPNLYDDTRPYTLPHSQVQVQISSRYWQLSTPDDRRPWIAPQIPVTLTSQDYFAQRDPALVAILNYAPAASPTVVPTPTAVPSPGQSVTFTTGDGVGLAGTVYGAGPRAVIFSNIGSGHQADWQDLPRLVAQRADLALTYDWRGLGASSGQPDYTASPKDLAAAIGYVQRRGSRQIVLVGASLGGIACLLDANIAGLAGLVVISSPQQAANLAVPAPQVLAISAPKLFIGSQDDTTVPLAQTRALYELARAPKSLQIYSGAAHGTDLLQTANHDDLVRWILDFVSAP